MVKSGTDRSAKYTAKFDPTVIGSRATAVKTIATEAQAALQEQLATKNAAVRAILDAAGIMPIRSVEYQAFSGKLFGICRKFSGVTAVGVAQLEYVKWKGYGSTAAVLQDIWALYSDVLGAEPSPL